MIWISRSREMDLNSRAAVMGILNTTPDSFSDGGRFFTAHSALDHARALAAEGATIIDIGGESSRPGALPVDIAEEIRRTEPVVRAVRDDLDGWISIDTTKAAVAEAALRAGADIVNDISGMRADPAMAEVCAAAGCGVVVMHMQRTPRDMQLAPNYTDVVAEIGEFFAERRAFLLAAGVRDQAIAFDPGIGFGKTLAHNLELLRAGASLAPAGRPLLIGVSRKSMIAKVLGDHRVSARDWPTVALTAWLRERGVMLHRVHEVRGCVDALRMTEAVLAANSSS